MYWRSILLTALKTEYPHYTEFAKIFRKYYYLNWIAGNTLTKIKQTSFNLIKWIKEKRSIDFIKNELEQNQPETLKRAIENLNGDIYNEKWCKPLLFLIEYNQTDDTNINFLQMSDRNIQVEHILPRAFASNNDWKTKFENNEETEKWINSGANLTLLSGTKNLQASNYGFEQKINAYTGKGFYADENEGITAFRITQKIVDDYTKNKYEKEWNENALKDRWNWFCGQVENVLDIHLTQIKK